MGSCIAFHGCTDIIMRRGEPESTKSEQQKQQWGSSRAVSAELPESQSNSSLVAIPFRVVPTSELDSSEDAEGDSSEVEEVEEEEEEEETGGEIGAEEANDGDEDVEEEEEEDDIDEEDEGEDEASESDEFEEELRAAAGVTLPTVQSSRAGLLPTIQADEEVGELLEFKRRKKVDMTTEEKKWKDKRIPTVKKELNKQKELLKDENKTHLQLNQPIRLDIPDRISNALVKNSKSENDYADVVQQNKLLAQPSLPTTSLDTAVQSVSKEATLRKLSKRHGVLSRGMQARFADDYANAEQKIRRLGAEKDVLAGALLKYLEEMAKNPKRWEDVQQLLSDLELSLNAIETQKRLSKSNDLFIPDSPITPTTSPTSSAPLDRSTRKPKRKKKKKKKPRHHKSTTTPRTTHQTLSSPAVLALATTETPWTTTTRTQSDAAVAKWRLVAERMFQPPWMQANVRNDDANVAKVRYTAPTKPRTMTSLLRPSLENKERESLEALNSERQALMLKAAREYSQPRVVHYGKINTRQQTSSDEDFDNVYESNERPYQRVHYGKLIVPSSSRLDYSRPSLSNQDQSLVRPDQPLRVYPSNPRLDLNFARNQEYIPVAREFAMNKAWEPADPYNGPWARLGESEGRPKTWNWQRPRVAQKNWPPWETERDYFEEENEDEPVRNWQRQQMQQQRQSLDWSRQPLRDNIPPWLEGKEIHRLLQTPNHWPKSEKSREYELSREQNIFNLGNNRNNNSELKNNAQSKQEDDSKESPKLTMKTWNSLTSDPATWPFKLPGAKPWPKDENGKSYNPNAELVRKLGLYKSGRLRPDNNILKDAKQQQKLQKSEKTDEVVNLDENRRLSKVNSWIEPNERRPPWYNMKLQESFEDVEAGTRERGKDRTWSSGEKSSDEWNNLTKAATSGNIWPAKWKQFAYHKVTAQPTSKSGVALDKPNKNAFIAVSAVAEPKYNNWRKSNDLDDVASQLNRVEDNPDHPISQIKTNVWKKSGNANGTERLDVLENQLENLKEDGPVLLEVNVSIKNSTSHEVSTSSPSTLAVIKEVPKLNGSNNGTGTENRNEHR